MPGQSQEISRRMRGFERASGLMQSSVRKVGESRGFAVSRVVTYWAEIVGADIAGMARPVKVNYGQGGLGATLTLLTTGANAPVLAMQTEIIRERVNACYGYAAISRVRIAQTAPEGFEDGRPDFGPPPAPKPKPAPTPEARAAAAEAAAPVSDPGLRRALELLGENVLSRSKEN